MSTSTSDHEMSDSSRSPHSYTLEAYGSPSQQVPQITNDLTGLTYADQYKGPFLRITEQPQNYFRFRYVSEMVGTHGCLLGISYATSRNKTHPTVELVNYSGRALIKCRLAQNKITEEHPHRLLEEEQEQDRDVSYIVPERGSYKVGFAGMGIIHTAKKDVPGLLFKKYMEKYKNTTINTKELKTLCENEAKGIDLNIVRLKFTAHDVETGREICKPVFSDPIHNMKSASTNDLKICRMSRHTGKPMGGEDIFMLVEKVNKKNIQIWFNEVDSRGAIVWSAQGHFLQSDVHHQYAIVVRSPPYRDNQICEDVKVSIKLVRPTDGRSSEPMEFTYLAEPVYKSNKKRKATSSCSSLNSSGSIKSISDLPAMIVFANNQSDIQESAMKIEVPQMSSPTHCDLANALMETESSYNMNSAQQSPMWGQPHAPIPSSLQIPDLKLDSAEFKELLLTRDTDMTPEVRKQLEETDFTEYLNSSLNSFGDFPDSENGSGMNFIRSLQMVRSDSGRAKGSQKVNPSTSNAGPSKSASQKQQNPEVADKAKDASQYSAFYKPEEGLEVKRLVAELCQMIRNKHGYKKQEVRSKLEKLFDIRLSNGDTFLHMTLCSNQPSFEYIVKIIHSVKMSHLLNYTNDKQQSILHLAVVYDLPRIVSLLVAKGCDPMLKDNEGDNVVHYAVRNQCCLEPLLDAISKNDVCCDLNDYNNEKQTALHLATNGTSARLLLQHGASYNIRDSQGRTPLHLAAYDDRLDVMKALLEFVQPSDIDAVDGCGNTALQIVCGGSIRDNSLAIVKLLLEKKADPLKREFEKESAWSLSRDKPDIKEIMRGCVPSLVTYEDDVKSEPEDEYESADEGESQEWLPELSLYAREVSAALDGAGAWRELARRLQLDALLTWYQAQPSPTLTLLNHLKECRNDVSSKSLMLTLEEMGQTEAANIIRRHME